MLAALLATEHDTLHFAAGLIETGLAPEGRAAATAATFRQLGDSAACDIHLTLADLVAGLELVAASRDGDPPPVAARRKTCAEIAELVKPVAPGGNPECLAQVFRCIESHFSRSTDPRQLAIATTAAREAAEIEAACGGGAPR
jgi:hypothetical protein